MMSSWCPYLKALADERRFRIVREVAAAGELTCGQLVEKFDLSQPTISHHLKILVSAGVLQVRNVAQHHYLSVDAALLDTVGELLPRRTRGEPRRKRPLRAKTAAGR
jgi:ArsR family transcriptional regulator